MNWARMSLLKVPRNYSTSSWLDSMTFQALAWQLSTSSTRPCWNPDQEVQSRKDQFLRSVALLWHIVDPKHHLGSHFPAGHLHIFIYILGLRDVFTTQNTMGGLFFNIQMQQGAHINDRPFLPRSEQFLTLIPCVSSIVLFVFFSP
jgi:hypothetical protein